jgi:hypothetical protein
MVLHVHETPTFYFIRIAIHNRTGPFVKQLMWASALAGRSRSSKRLF